jgi:hypothetical protein
MACKTRRCRVSRPLRPMILECAESAVRFSGARCSGDQAKGFTGRLASNASVLPLLRPVGRPVGQAFGDQLLVGDDDVRGGASKPCRAGVERARCGGVHTSFIGNSRRSSSDANRRSTERPSSSAAVCAAATSPLVSACVTARRDRTRSRSQAPRERSRGACPTRFLTRLRFDREGERVVRARHQQREDLAEA